MARPKNTTTKTKSKSKPKKAATTKPKGKKIASLRVSRGNPKPSRARS